MKIEQLMQNLKKFYISNKTSKISNKIYCLKDRYFDALLLD